MMMDWETRPARREGAAAQSFQAVR